MKIITKNNRRSRYNFFEIQIGRVVSRCIFCYIQHCAKSKFCANRSRNYTFPYNQLYFLCLKPFFMFFYNYNLNVYYIQVHIYSYVLSLYILIISIPSKIHFKLFLFVIYITCFLILNFHFNALLSFIIYFLQKSRKHAILLYLAIFIDNKLY